MHMIDNMIYSICQIVASGLARYPRKNSLLEIVSMLTNRRQIETEIGDNDIHVISCIIPHMTNQLRDILSGLLNVETTSQIHTNMIHK